VRLVHSFFLEVIRIAFMSPTSQKLTIMMNTELTKRSIAQIGEAISHDLGSQMIKDYQSANPTDTKNYTIGRDILDQILAQPGCVGLRFYNAYNEIGEKTLVYVGVDNAGKSLIEYVVVHQDGNLGAEKAIVADRTVNNDSDLLTTVWEWLFA